jgi:23S rRNA pseudouridine1911/1915/1917 synthase
VKRTRVEAVEVPAVLAGTRIDRVVALLTGVSRAEARRLVEEGLVGVNGRPVTAAAHKLAGGERLVLELPDDEGTGGAGALPSPDPGVPFTVVYEDADLLVIDKPAGVVVHPGAGVREQTLVSGLLARYPDLADLADLAGEEDAGSADRPGIVHRLDKGTSGLLVVARTPEALVSLRDQLAAHTLRRQYLAFVRGHVAADEGIIDAPIGRSMRNRTRMAVAGGPDARPARTGYRVRRRADEPIAASDLELTLETGRTHQIRVHMASIGHPVLGDTTYGDRKPVLGLGRPFLHAWKLGVEHPRSGEQLGFVAELPAELVAVAEQLR